MSGWAKFTIGIAALFFAWIFVISRKGSPHPGVLWVLAGVCVLIALACFSRTARVPSLRIIGGAIFLAYVAYLIGELRKGIFRPYPGRASEHWLNALEGLYVWGLPGLYLALRGIYPSWGRAASLFRGESHSPDHEQDEDHLD